MCVVSSVGDHFGRRWDPIPFAPDQIKVWRDGPSREEFEQLKREVQECKRLLQAAKEIDTALGNEDCEMEEKLEVIRKVAELVGVDLEDVLG